MALVAGYSSSDEEPPAPVAPPKPCKPVKNLFSAGDDDSDSSEDEKLGQSEALDTKQRLNLIF